MQKNTDELKLLFPTVLQVSQVENHEALNELLLKAITEIRSRVPSSKPDSWACDLYTTIGNPTALGEYSGLNVFWDLVQHKLNAYALSLSYDVSDSPLRVSDCWVNIYKSTHSQEIHLHRNSMVSGIYYVKAPPGSGPTLFYSPMSDVMLEPRVKEGNAMNAKVSGLPAVEGRLLLFRSSLRHSVLPGEFDGERITVAFNAVV